MKKHKVPNMSNMELETNKSFCSSNVDGKTIYSKIIYSKYFWLLCDDVEAVTVQGLVQFYVLLPTK